MSAVARESEKIQILTWLIGGQMFGMELGACREVVQDRLITNVPYAQQNVAGIVNLRGDVVTVLDLSVLLGYDKIERKKAIPGKESEEVGEEDAYVIIRVKSDYQQVALKADRIYDIIEIERKKLEPPPAHLSELETRFINGVAMTERGLVVLLNQEELLAAS